MGQRANLIIVDNSGYELYYDHWAANSLDSYLFWGSEYSIQWIKSHDIDDTYWLDTTWCEGGAVVDLRKNHLIFFGGEDILYELPLRNMYLDLLQFTWSGWSIQWARRGILDLASYVGYDEKKLMAESNFEFLDKSKVKSALSPCSIETARAVVSVIKNKRIFLFPSDEWELLDVLSGGFSILEELSKEFPEKLDLRETSEFPNIGIHFNIDDREIFYWTADVGYSSISYDEFWPGWKIENLFDDYSKHFDLLGEQLILPLQNKAKLLSRIEDIVCRDHKDPISFAKSFVDRINEKSDNVKVNPAIYLAKGFNMDLVDKVRIFQEIKKMFLK